MQLCEFKKKKKTLLLEMTKIIQFHKAKDQRQNNIF